MKRSKCYSLFMAMVIIVVISFFFMQKEYLLASSLFFTALLYLLVVSYFLEEKTAADIEREREERELTDALEGVNSTSSEDDEKVAVFLFALGGGISVFSVLYLFYQSDARFQYEFLGIEVFAFLFSLFIFICNEDGFEVENVKEIEGSYIIAIMAISVSIALQFWIFVGFMGAFIVVSFFFDAMKQKNELLEIFMCFSVACATVFISASEYDIFADPIKFKHASVFMVCMLIFLLRFVAIYGPYVRKFFFNDVDSENNISTVK